VICVIEGEKRTISNQIIVKSIQDKLANEIEFNS